MKNYVCREKSVRKARAPINTVEKPCADKYPCFPVPLICDVNSHIAIISVSVALASRPLCGLSLVNERCAGNFDYSKIVDPGIQPVPR